MYTIIYGLLLTLGAAKIVPFDVPTNMTHFINNIIFGISVSYLIIRFSGDQVLKRGN